MAVTISRQPENKIIGIADKIMLYGLPILYFLISVAFYLRTYDSAQIKITMIQIGGTIIITAFIIKLLEENIVDYLKENTVYIVPLLLFLFSGVLSYSHSPFPLASANELTRRIIYICFSLLVAREFNSHRKFNTLFNWLIAATYVATIYGVIQFLDTRFFPPAPEPGLDPFVWRGAFGERVFSTFGNPNFYGDFLVVMSPIVLALSLYKRDPFLVILWVLILFNTIWTQSKGAWLGFGVGILVFFFLAA